jgi:hypothetical protein
MLADTSLGYSLKNYELPPGLLLRAPSRRLFANFSAEALDAAAALTIGYPEKTGIFSRAVRTTLNLPAPLAPADPLIIEAHIDANELPQEIADRLMSLGFEIDGFSRFMPRHFSEHYTLKMRVGRRDVERRSQLWAFAQSSITAAKACLTAASLEAYIEVETYTRNCRRFWDERPQKPRWEVNFPLASGQMRAITPPRNQREATAEGLPLQVVKKADIHVKLTKHPDNMLSRLTLIDRLVAAGFYHVTTWAPNDVCTAQFAKLSDARAVFLALNRYFDNYGGCVENTLEYAPELWRSERQTPQGIQLCELPPLIVSVA